MRILSKIYRQSAIVFTLRISLYREWLRLSNLNRQLKRANQPSLTIIPVEDRYDGILYWLSKNTELDYFEPDMKILKQGYRETNYMYII